MTGKLFLAYSDVGICYNYEYQSLISDGRFFQMIRYAVVGTGWRSEFYARIANALPEDFQMTAWLCRSTEKMERLHDQYGIHTTTSEDEVADQKPDFLVCAVNKTSISEVSEYWAEKGIPVLSETPAALDPDTLKHLKKRRSEGLSMQVAEQYFLMPDLKAMIQEAKSGIIGEPESVTISAMHDYHAVSVIRRLLNSGFEGVRITGKTFKTRVTNTKTRYETLTDGRIIDVEQKHLILEYESGKTAFYDFMPEQYRSPIRNRFINVRGTRGEIINDTVYYLDDRNIPAVKKLDVVNPYEKNGLNYDEAAIADFLVRMKRFVETGQEAYPYDEALYDAYLSILMNKAGSSSYETFTGGPRQCGLE